MHREIVKVQFGVTHARKHAHPRTAPTHTHTHTCINDNVKKLHKTPAN